MNRIIEALVVLLWILPTAYSYTLPPWWDLISDDPTIFNLKTCFKREGVAPNDGSKCGRFGKTCFFGIQECEGVGPYPTTSCVCTGDGIAKGNWICESLVCPPGSIEPSGISSSSNAPSTAPTVGSTNAGCDVNNDESSCPWTGWLNRDSPSGVGDFENIDAFRLDGVDICGGQQPLHIECQAIRNSSSILNPPIDADLTGESITCDVCQGLFCVNALQPDGRCDFDYRVRYQCRCEPTSEPSSAPSISNSPTEQCPNIDSDCPWSNWLDRDNPSGYGDYEDLSAFAASGIFPCAGGVEPLAIECQAFRSRDSLTPLDPPIDAGDTGEIVTCDKCRGGYCVNALQPDGRCDFDYRIRFKCPCTPTSEPSAAPSLSIPPTQPGCSSSNVGDFFINDCEEKCVCESRESNEITFYNYVCYREREEFTCMTEERRKRFIDTYKEALAVGNPTMLALLEIHENIMGVHNVNKFFLPWHRWYIKALEDVLRQYDCRVTVPWWRWSKKSGSWWIGSPFQANDSWLGTNGVGGGQCVPDGPFGGTWNPANEPGTCLRRQFFFGSFPTAVNVASVISNAKTEPVANAAEFDAFSMDLEGAVHLSGHGLIGGMMAAQPTASKSPEFFLHHGYIDQIWDAWQTKGGTFFDPYGYGNPTLPDTIPAGTVSVGDHLDLKKSGVIYVDIQSSTTPDPEPYLLKCRLIVLCPECPPNEVFGYYPRYDEYRYDVYNYRDFEEGLYTYASNNSLDSIPQRPSRVETLEEMRKGFFWTAGKVNGIPDEVLEDELVKMQERQVAANAALQSPITAFKDDASTMAGYDVGAVAALIRLCPIGSEWDPAAANCTAVDRETQILIDDLLSTSLLYLGDLEDDVSTVRPTLPPNLIPGGVILGKVSCDRNNDNVGDDPLAGVPVVLLDAAGAIAATTLTNEGGNYEFANLDAGVWTITQTNIDACPWDVEDADGGDPSSIQVTIGPGDWTAAGNDFLDEPNRSVSGQVLEDIDNDNAGDSPIPAVLLSVTDPSGVVFGTTLTDSSGAWTFSGPPGIWTLSVTADPSLGAILDWDGGDPTVTTVDVSSQDFAAVNFIFARAT